MSRTQQWRVVVSVDGREIREDTISIPAPDGPDEFFRPYFTTTADHLGGYSQDATIPSKIYVEVRRIS